MVAVSRVPVASSTSRPAPRRKAGAFSSERSGRSGNSGPAVRARPVEHDLVLGDVERDALGDAVERRLELVVGERDDLAAARADHVMVMVGAGAVGLVAGDALADLDLRQQPEPLELLEGPVHARAGDPPPALAQLRLDLVCGQGARLVVQQLDDRRTGAAAAEAGVREARRGELGPGSGGGTHRPTAYLRGACTTASSS